MKHLVLLLTLTLFGITYAHAQADLCVMSDASASAYDDGWQDGDNDGTGFEPWIQFELTGDDPDGNNFFDGFFVFTSTENGDGIDDNGDGDIDTGDRAWGLYANSGGQATAFRRIKRPVGAGGTVAFSYDHGPVIDGGGQHNFTLVNALGNVLSYTYGVSYNTEYWINDADGFRSTGVPLQSDGEGIRVEVEVLSEDGEYEMAITTLGDGTTYSVPGQFFASAEPRIGQLDFNNNNNGPGAVHNLYANSLEACITLADLLADIEALIEFVASYEDDGVLNKGQANALTVKLRQAASLMERDKPGEALEVLMGFRDQVAGWSGGVLTEEEADALLDALDPILDIVAAQTTNGMLRTAPVADQQGTLQAAAAPTAFALEPNYPNPFNPVTVIAYELPEASDVSVRVFNTLGQEVAVLATGFREAGRHEVRFDARGLSAGVYLYVLEAGSHRSMRQMVLLK